MPAGTASSGTGGESLLMEPVMQEQIILVCSIFAILFGLYNVYKVLSVKVNASGKSGDDIEMQARDGN